MKRLLFIPILLSSLHVVCAQETFFDIYSSVLAKDDIHNARLADIDRTHADSATRKLKRYSQYQAYSEENGPLLSRVKHLTFPDISFTDISGKVYALSDFKQDLIINYNYMFCATCMNRIDLTLEKTRHKNVKLLVLFAEDYRKDHALLKSYDNRVVIGFMNDETTDFVSLRQGDDCMYYLDEERRVEFYDRQNHEAWIKFLEKDKQ